MEVFDFVKIYRNAIPVQFCDHLISKYNTVTPQVYKNNLYSFESICLNECGEIFTREINYLLNLYNLYVEKYKEELNIKYLPKKYGWEHLRLKKYDKGGFFGEHVDVYDYSSARRFLSMFTYLNDGGGTKMLDKEIESEKGTLVIYPPLWLYPHSAIVKQEKYFLTTYLHYI